jgi:hypothetical protein
VDCQAQGVLPAHLASSCSYSFAQCVIPFFLTRIVVVGKNGFLECLQLLLEKGYHVDCPTVRAHFLNHKKTIAAFTVYSCNRKGWRKKDSFNICCAWKSL